MVVVIVMVVVMVVSSGWLAGCGRLLLPPPTSCVPCATWCFRASPSQHSQTSDSCSLLRRTYAHPKLAEKTEKHASWRGPRSRNRKKNQPTPL